jgi:hypothetical protein
MRLLTGPIASRVARRLPLGATAGEVAHAALHLAEDTFTTGITLDIDGGKR